MKIKRIIIPLLLIILLASTIAFGTSVPLGPYFDDTYFDLSDSALILKVVPHEKGGLEADVSAYDGLLKISGGSTSAIKIKLDATEAPTVNNDVDEGYTAGSRWVDVTNDKEYVCLDNTDGAAVWTETTGAGGGASQLSDLSDVGVTTPTDKYVLVADGDSWESRALVEADISDLGVYLEDITGESIFDLSDVSADPGADKYAKWDDDSGELIWVDASGYTNLTSFVDQTAWRVFYSNADGDVIELALGDDGTYLRSNGATSAPTFGTPSGAGDMLKATYDTDEDGDIDVAAGGTEKSVWTLYAIPYLSGTTTFGEITIGTVGQVLKVSAGATGYEFGDESDPTVDTDAEIKAILVDEVIKTGDFTAGRMAIISNATGIIEEGTNTDTEVTDAVTKKHSQNTDTTLIFTNALASDHTYSGEVDSQPVGESVVFGQLLYYDWTDVEWKLAKADAFATAKAERIALESKADGETCLMLVKGYIRDDSAFDFGASVIFLNDDTAGTCDDTAPAESGDQIQVVGTAKSADILFFDPSIDVGEI